jgi:DNA-binding CsgD family transcriptional regulator/tetratricopeptide (TPR) repeat protein
MNSTGKREFEATSGITLSRTTAPRLSPNYLDRKHLHHLVDNQTPGTTLIVAPAGYGKTSLVASWAATKKNVIWLTISQGDSLTEISSLFIQATRNLIPGFALWFETDQPLRASEIMRRWGNELLETGEDFIFVLDNLRVNIEKDIDVASRLVQQFPSNLHFVTLRSDALEESLSILASRGNLKVVEAHLLKFSDEETRALAETLGIPANDPAIAHIHKSSLGWPIVTSMLLNKYVHGKEILDFEMLAASQNDPVRILADQVVDDLEPEILESVSMLSLVNEFDHSLAEIMMGNKYSFELINSIAIQGNLFSQSDIEKRTFSFSPLMREVLLNRIRRNPELKLHIHQHLATYFEELNKPHLALENAILCGDTEKISRLFPDAIRLLQASGRGAEIIRFAKFAGDGSLEGTLKKSTVEVTGHLTSLNFGKVSTMMEQAFIDAEGSPLQPFVEQLFSGAKAYVDFAFGRFEEFEESFVKALANETAGIVLAAEEKIALIRLAASRAFILDETEKVEDLLKLAESLTKASRVKNNYLFILAIRSMAQWQVGDYRAAYETSSAALDEFHKNGFVGIMGPLEVMYVKAKSLIEFAQPQEAVEIFKQIRDLAREWNQWTWFYMASDYLSRDLIHKGRILEAQEFIKSERELLNSMPIRNELSKFANLAEIYLRYTGREWKRVETLLEVSIQNRFTSQVKIHVDNSKGLASINSDIASLPERTSREKIWKYLALADLVIDQETLAISHIKRALHVGASVGAKEVFLRQGDRFADLIFKIATETPTIYLDDLASSMAERMRSRQARPDQISIDLTKRETEILRHLATERTISAIAASLHISINTMKTHLKSLYRKMEVDGRTNAVARAKELFIL